MELSCSSASAPKPLLSSLHSSFSAALFRSASVSFRRSPPPRRGCVCLFGLGVPELVVIAGVAALVFGPKKLPEIGRSIGKTVKSFQEAAKEFETELKKEPEENADSTGSLEEKPDTIAKEEGKKEFEASGTKETA